MLENIGQFVFVVKSLDCPDGGNLWARPGRDELGRAGQQGVGDPL